LHYLFEQATATGIVTLRVMTENFVELFNFPLGQMQADPIITGDVVDNQIMFNSPSFSTPLFGYTGGGIISAVAQASIQPNTTAIEIPNGHICGFGDRFVIAQYTDFFVSDPNDAFRSYVGENAVGIGGTIFDIFQGPDGALFLSTSAGAFSLVRRRARPRARSAGLHLADPRHRHLALTQRHRRAAGVVVVLQRDHVQILDGPAINLAPYTGRRFSRARSTSRICACRASSSRRATASSSASAASAGTSSSTTSRTTRCTTCGARARPRRSTS
jgi:hypothetical protein